MMMGSLTLLSTGFSFILHLALLSFSFFWTTERKFWPSL